MRILVTGAAGFIGYHLASALLDQGHEVLGVDNVNAYYDPSLKEARLARLRALDGFSFDAVDVSDLERLRGAWTTFRPNRVAHLAAQAGVRYSLQEPRAYVESNLIGTFNVFECARALGVENLIYASTSSAYGLNRRLPFSAHQACAHPASFYAATKIANELTAHSYSHLFGIPTTGLRFFTVYGPWGRPDMALFEFTRKILAGQPIDVFNRGQHRRDFTYVDDVVQGVLRVLLGAPPAADPAWDRERADPATSSAPWRIYNIGNGRPVELMRYIEALEAALGRKAERRMLPMQPGDIEETAADISDLARDFGYRPATTIEAGIARFVEWYRDYYRV